MKAAYLSVIVTYVPHKKHSRKGMMAADLFSKLQQTVSVVSKHDVLKVLGDFNSRLVQGINGLVAPYKQLAVGEFTPETMRMVGS